MNSKSCTSKGPVEIVWRDGVGVSANTAQSKVWRKMLGWTFGSDIADQDSQTIAHRLSVACCIFLYNLQAGKVFVLEGVCVCT